MNPLPMKYALICLAALCLATTAMGQKTKKIKLKSSDKDIKKTYRVLKSDMTTLHGDYTYAYQGNVISKGAYKLGKRNGPWQFGNRENGMFIEANFANGEKDGTFRYSDDGRVLSELYYDQGKVDSLFAFTDKGKVLTELHVDDSGNGEEKHYYESGQLMHYNPIRDFAVDGNVKSYYPNGQLLQEVVYENDRPLTVVHTYDAQGNEMDGGTLKNGSGEIITYRIGEEGEALIDEKVTYKNKLKEGPFYAYGKEGRPVVEGQYSADARDGKWITQTKGGPKVETYENEKAASPGSTGDSSRTGYLNSIAFTVVEQMPSFPGGETGLMNFLGRNITYPKMARDAGAQGTTYVMFVVNEYGDVVDIKIDRSVHPSIDMEVMRVVNLMPNWQPGMQHGVPVKVQYNLPVRMRLN